MLSKGFLISVIKKSCSKIENRNKDYKDQLYKNVCSALYHEWKHMESGGEINKKILQEVEDLAKNLKSERE